MARTLTMSSVRSLDHQLAFCILMPTLILVQSFYAGSGSASSSDNADELSFKLALTNLDFGLPNVTLFQGLQRGLRRSSLRLRHIQQQIVIQKAQAELAGADVSFETPVSAALGGFVTIASIGTPAVSFTAIVDTGSDLVWRQCLPCQHCYEQDSGTIFSPSHSSTYEQANCTDILCSALGPRSTCSSSSSTSPTSAGVCSYFYSYEDQSFTVGDFAYDTLTLPDVAGRPGAIRHFAFGCGHNNGHGDFGGAGGLIGFGRGPVSLPSQLRTPQFSYCLQSIADAAFRTSPLVIGAAAADLHDQVLSTPLISNPAAPSLYFVKLEGMSVGSNAIPIPTGTFDIQEDGSGGIIVDSGTTLTYLASPAYDALLAALRAIIPLPPVGSSVLELCYSGASLAQLEENAPALTFHFQGADVRLPFTNSFVRASEELLCLAFGRSSGRLSIYGNIQQQNFHILYDLEAHLLSFAPAACDSL